MRAGASTVGCRDGGRSLVSAAQGGERDAVEQLLRSHYDQIHAICRRLAGNDADAQDATQQALIAIVRGLPHFQGRSRFSTWAYRVATNAALDELRRRARRPVPMAPDDAERLAGSQQRADPAAAVAAAADIDDALAQLPLRFRAPVVLRDLAGCDYAEIGSILCIPPGTVRSRIARGRARLADALTPPGGDQQPTTRTQTAATAQTAART